MSLKCFVIGLIWIKSVNSHSFIVSLFVYYVSRNTIAYVTHVSIQEALFDNSYRPIIDHLHYIVGHGIIAVLRVLFESLRLAEKIAAPIYTLCDQPISVDFTNQKNKLAVHMKANK